MIHCGAVEASGKYITDRSSVADAPGTKNWPIAPHGSGRNCGGIAAPAMGLAMNIVMTAPTAMPGGPMSAARPMMSAEVALTPSPMTVAFSSQSPVSIPNHVCITSVISAPAAMPKTTRPMRRRTTPCTRSVSRMPPSMPPSTSGKTDAASPAPVLSPSASGTTSVTVTVGISGGAPAAPSGSCGRWPDCSAPTIAVS